MKKLTDFLKPNILIVFGALMFLFFLNLLADDGIFLAIGIMGIICAVYYLGVGILEVIIGNKLPESLKKILEIVSVSLYAVFMFVYFLLLTIYYAGANPASTNFMGPTAWIIAILSMIASLALAGFYIVSKLVKLPLITRLSYLFAAIFALALLLNILFDPRGDSVVLGNIDIILVVIYIVFTFYLFNALEKLDSAPKKEEKEESEPAPEQAQEEPAPEAKAE